MNQSALIQGGCRHAVALAAGMLLLAGSAQAVSVAHAASNLPDLVPGEDLWQFDFSISGPLPELNTVNLLFSPAEYAQLALLANVPAGALEAAPETQPDNLLGTAGQITLTANSSLGPSFAGSVSMSFVWTGQGAPGAVPFELLDESFSVLETGFSVPVPEPATWGMFAAGLLLLGRRRQR